MKKLLLSCAVLTGAALTYTSASAELLNQWLFDQIKASSVQSQAEGKAEVVKDKAEVVQVPQTSEAQPAPASVDAGQSAAMLPVNSGPAPIK